MSSHTPASKEPATPTPSEEELLALLCSGGADASSGAILADACASALFRARVASASALEAALVRGTLSCLPERVDWRR